MRKIQLVMFAVLVLMVFLMGNPTIPILAWFDRKRIPARRTFKRPARIYSQRICSRLDTWAVHLKGAGYADPSIPWRAFHCASG